MVIKRFYQFVFLAVFVVMGFAFTSPVLGQTCVTTKPPADAVVLFNGKDAEGWVKKDSKEPAPWKVEDGALVASESDIQSTQEFGDHQLHLEFQIPQDPKNPADGNSGVYVHGFYEIQVLNSHGRAPESHQCGGIYGQVTPLVNASLPMGEWQSYDIFFHQARYDEQGKEIQKARISVLHNGIWIHHDAETGLTNGSLERDPKGPGPLMLQYHGAPIHYRNIWIRPIGAVQEPAK